MDTRRRRRWAAAAWIAAVTATAVNGLVVGYGAVWFQLFGETADAEDYRVSAGGYGAAAIVLAVAVVGILTHGAPRWLAWAAGASAAFMGVLAASSASASARAEPVPASIGAFWDGIGGVVWAPWTWALVALAVHRPHRRGETA